MDGKSQCPKTLSDQGLSGIFVHLGCVMYKRVYVEITNICNMNCSFCHGHSRPMGQMSADEFKIILEKLTGYTNYIYYHLMGEPLTHPQLPDFVKLAGQRGFRSIITTNGTLLAERAEALLSAGVYKVNLSIHSFEEGSMDAHAAYLRDLTMFADRAASAGTIVNFRLWNQGFDSGKNEFALQTLQQYLPGDWIANTRGIRIRDKLFVELGERFEWPDTDADIQGDRFNCHGLKDQFGILVDGTVVPCCLDSDGIIDLGNIFTDDLPQILSSKRATELLEGFRRGIATEDLCKKCGYAQRFVR